MFCLSVSERADSRVLPMSVATCSMASVERSCGSRRVSIDIISRRNLVSAYGEKNDAEKSFGVKLIPLEDSQVTLTAEDALVVVAEDDL